MGSEDQMDETFIILVLFRHYHYFRYRQVLLSLQRQRQTAEWRRRHSASRESDIGVTTTQRAGAARRGECHFGRKIKRMEKRKKKSTTKPDWNTNNIL